LIQSQIEHELSDAEKALLLIALVNFALGGKKTDNSVVLSKGYAGKTNEKGKPSTGKPGPALGFMGFLHNFVTGSTLTETIWLNLLSKDQIAAIPYIDKANCLGTAPWEKMPEGEYCSRAKELITTYLGRLVPISRFVLLAEDGLHYSEGINYPGYANGGYDISTSVEYAGKKPRALWVDTEKRPWRQLTAILSFLANEQKNTFDCQQVRFAIPKAKRAASKIGLWSGGLCVSSNAGEQYASGSDDFVESEISFDSSWLGEEWFLRLKAEMAIIDELSRNDYGCTMGYYKHQLADGKNQAAQASNLFWQHAEHHFQALLDACGNSTSESIRPIFVKAALKAYDEYCPKETARQLDAWAANRPQLGKLLSSANTQTGSVS
jgi:CRISPR system Cascade subunit CasA